jgi:hypothetical protein
VALVRTVVSEEFVISVVRVTRIGELGTTLAVTSNRRMLEEILVTVNWITDSCHPQDRSDTFFRNVGSYKTNMASHPR